MPSAGGRSGSPGSSSKRRRNPVDHHAERHERIYQPAGRAAHACSSRPTRKSRAANSRPSPAGCSSAIPVSFVLPGFRESTGRSARNTRRRRSADGISGYRIKSLNADGSITTAPQSDEYYPVFFSTEPKTSMVYGLDYATAPERRATLERARDNDVIATLRDRLYQPKNGVRPIGVARHRSGLRQGHFADHDRRPAAQSGRLHRRHIRSPPLLHSIRTTTAASPAVRIDVYPPDAGRIAEGGRRCRFFVRAAAAWFDACSRDGAALVGELSRSATPTGRCGQLPPPAVR